jgi:hypothetical protein
MKTTVVAGTAGGDAQAEASVVETTTANATVICHEAKIPQQSEV